MERPADLPFTTALNHTANARKLPRPVTSLTTPPVSSTARHPVRRLQRDPQLCREAPRRDHGRGQHQVHHRRQLRPLVQPFPQPLPGRAGGFQPVELPQPGARRLGDERQEGERPGCAVRPGELLRGGRTQPRQAVIDGMAERRSGRPEGQGNPHSVSLRASRSAASAGSASG